jgi:hypothetical protein
MADAKRRGYGEDGVYFDHRETAGTAPTTGPVLGRWRDVVSLGFDTEGTRPRKKVTGSRGVVPGAVHQLGRFLLAALASLVSGYLSSKPSGSGWPHPRHGSPFSISTAKTTGTSIRHRVTRLVYQLISALAPRSLGCPGTTRQRPAFHPAISAGSLMK